MSSTLSRLLSGTILGATSLLVAVPAFAEAPAASRVSEVIVTASRIEEDKSRSPVDATVLTGAQIEAAQSVSIAELISRTPGVYFERNGGPGKLTAIRIRGAESADTVVLIDGVKVNDPSTPSGSYSFENLLAGDIERVEILRGPQSALWGSNAVGGVVNVISKVPTGDLEGRVNLEAGSFSTRSIGLSGGFGGEWGGVRLSASDYKTDGISAFAQSRGGVDKDGIHQKTVGLRADLKLGDVAALDLRASAFDADGDIDGNNMFFEFSDQPYTSDSRGVQGYAGLKFETGETLSHVIGASYARTERESFLGYTTASRGASNRLNYQGDWTINDKARLIFGAEQERSWITIGSNQRRVGVSSVYGQLRLQPTDALNLTLGGRHDDHDTYGTFQTVQLGAVYALNEGGTRLRFNFAQGFRAPSLNELYGLYGANPNLSPEESDGWDVGVEQSLFGDQARVSAVWFNRETTSKIIYTTGYINQSRTESKGVELAGDWAISDGVSLSANYTWTDSKGTNGQRAVRRPEHMANLDLSYSWESGVSASAAVTHVGERRDYDETFTLINAKGYTRLDVRGAWPVNDRVEIYGRVENLTDETYETVTLYGAPGRSAYAGVRVTF